LDSRNPTFSALCLRKLRIIKTLPIPPKLSSENVHHPIFFKEVI
jgi:hypothetical protein